MRLRQQAHPARSVESRRHRLPVRRIAPQPAPALVIQRKCACGGSCPKCQEEEGHPIPKKAVLSMPGDHHEQEADRIADAVVRGGAAPRLSTTPIEQPSTAERHAPPLVRNVLESPGRPLDARTRAFMESRMGHDLSDVRIHDDGRAAASAQSLDALAYTVDRHIVFGAGQFQPDSDSGRRLLAHELAHTVQQKSAPPRIMRRPAPAPARRCGPNVTAEIGRVWHQVESDFGGWAPAVKSDACLHLIWPLVTEGNARLFWPFVAGRLHLPASGTISSVLQTGLAAGVELGHLAGAGARLVDELAGTSLSTAIDWAHLFDFRDLFAFRPNVVYNKDAFDTLGLFVNCTGWLARPPVLRAGCCRPQPTGHQTIEDASLCSTTVQAGSECWLSGTVNYGTFGVMMRLCADWGEVLTDLALRVADPRIRALPGPVQGIARGVVIQAARAWTAALYSETATNMLVQIYKRLDRDDPGPPSRWALATYRGGAAGIASGGNRPKCPATCPSSLPVPRFDYVWETAKHRSGSCPPGVFPASGAIPPSTA